MAIGNVRHKRLDDARRENIEDSEKPELGNVDRPDHIARAEQFTTQPSLVIC